MTLSPADALFDHGSDAGVGAGIGQSASMKFLLRSQPMGMGIGNGSVMMGGKVVGVGSVVGGVVTGVVVVGGGDVVVVTTGGAVVVVGTAVVGGDVVTTGEVVVGEGLAVVGVVVGFVVVDGPDEVAAVPDDGLAAGAVAFVVAVVVRFVTLAFGLITLTVVGVAVKGRAAVVGTTEVDVVGGTVVDTTAGEEVDVVLGAAWKADWADGAVFPNTLREMKPMTRATAAIDQRQCVTRAIRRLASSHLIRRLNGPAGGGTSPA